MLSFTSDGVTYAMISGFGREVGELSVVGYCAVCSGNSSPTFRDILNVTSQCCILLTERNSCVYFVMMAETRGTKVYVMQFILSLRFLSSTALGIAYAADRSDKLP